MAAVAKKDVQVSEDTRRIRITLASTKVEAVERVTRDLLQKSQQEKVTTHGPLRLPTKILRITTRRAPSGQGTQTFERYQMRIHKRVLDVVASTDVVRKITSIRMDPSVDVEISVGSA